MELLGGVAATPAPLGGSSNTVVIRGREGHHLMVVPKVVALALVQDWLVVEIAFFSSCEAERQQRWTNIATSVAFEQRMVLEPQKQAFFVLATKRLSDDGTRFEALHPSMSMERPAMREQINALYFRRDHEHPRLIGVSVLHISTVRQSLMRNAIYRFGKSIPDVKRFVQVILPSAHIEGPNLLTWYGIYHLRQFRIGL